MQFGNKRSFRVIKKRIPTAHFERCVDINQSIKYCQKDDSRIGGPWEFGVMPQGAVTRATVDYLRMTEEELIQLPLTVYLNARRA